MKKTFTRILSVLCAIAMLSSLFLMPANAAPAKTATYTLRLEHNPSMTNLQHKPADVWKLIVSVETDAYLLAEDVYITYNADVFKPYGGQPVASKEKITNLGTDNLAPITHPVNVDKKPVGGRPLGDLADNKAYDASGNSAANDGTLSAVAYIGAYAIDETGWGGAATSDAYFYLETKDSSGAPGKTVLRNAGYTGDETNIGIVRANFSQNGVPATPVKNITPGKQDIYEIYLQLQPGAKPEDCTFKFGGTQTTGSKTDKAFCTTFGDGFSMTKASKGIEYTYGSEVVESPLTRTQTAVKYAKDRGANAYDLRVRSEITKDALAAKIGGSDAATVKAQVKTIGFVASNAKTIDVKGVKAALAAPDKHATYGDAEYAVGTTNSLYDQGTSFGFGAIVETSTARGDFNYNAFIELADGSFIFYTSDVALNVANVKTALPELA